MAIQSIYDLEETRVFIVVQYDEIRGYNNENKNQHENAISKGNQWMDLKESKLLLVYSMSNEVM